ncbi:MAG: hypothetical protein P8Q26_15665 [Ascidiaceihabitans sp.]|nr:hypothetical protein [Ascidiaceihabitans sp.]
MRDFLVRSLNKIIWLVFIAMIIGTIAGALIALSQHIVLGVLVFFGGLLLSMFIAGSFFVATGIYELCLGIYNNTACSADALEALAGVDPAG